MKYALLQATLDIPPIDSLKRAFRHVRGLTEIDAYTMARDAFGILVKDLDHPDAASLQSLLRQEGVETEVVPHSAIPAMPNGKFLQRMDCLEDHLLLYDPLGRSFPLPYQHIWLIAAGRVQTVEFKRVPEETTARRLKLDGSPYFHEKTVYRSMEETRQDLMLEIVLSRAVMRYSASGQRLQYNYLADRQSRFAEENFVKLLQDLAKFCPQATLNRGTLLARDQSQLVDYPTRNAFNEEILWFLWKMGIQSQPVD